MKQPRIISVGGCLAALLVAGCSGVSPSSTINPLGGVASQGAIDAPSTTTQTPLNRCRQGLHVSPNHATIKVNQQLHLHDYYLHWDSPICEQSYEPASWTASGGVIQPVGGGKEAVFFALLPGVYRVNAKWSGSRAHSTVTVIL